MFYTLEKRYDKEKFEKGIVALLEGDKFIVPIGDKKIYFTGDEGYAECIAAGLVHEIPGGAIIYNGARTVNWPYSREFRFDPQWSITRPIILIKNIHILSSFENGDFDGIQSENDALVFLHDISKESEIRLEGGGYLRWKFDKILEIKCDGKIIYEGR
jgi:hypothetical protein